MPKYKTRDHWKAQAIETVYKQHSALICVEYALEEVPEVEALLWGSNRALQNSADTPFISSVAAIAIDIGLITPRQDARFGREHISLELLSLSQLGKIACDVDDPTAYYHPNFRPHNTQLFKYEDGLVVGKLPAMPEQPYTHQ